ncbi:acyl-CoA dehydrogenase family protein [Phytomonospora endophytica]|uniref:Glutaryl-CoA dehydrogenase n=1 Tax=Phytomonospora endophytica TaxID=714109 RepID=A0A841FH96_9ACTN|nr:acyl-CoA dehydrogenase family protein [Phytomonospora endophytica]MBB6035586.1 glutaryl-CoA dehydrogenase [Phytomonospora endophytica]GIG70052.1 glutaryl-CoA dehydrogenase [Phytomonospora endophytica]
MAIAPTRPALLDADFYSFQDVLTPVEREAAARLRDFLEREIRPIADDQWDRAEFPHQVIPGLAELGILGPMWPETARFTNSAVFRGWAALELARVDCSIATFVGVTSGLAMGSIGIGGSTEQRAAWLPAMGRGELVGAFGLTEPLAGSDTARGLRTTATRRGDTWILDGAKRWIGNATFADVTVIMAKDTADDRVKAFLVRKGTPGFTATKIERKQALRTVQNADITLTGVAVPESDRLAGIDSFRDVAKILRATRANVAWQAIGVSVGAYEAAVRYAREREQFGKPIGAYQLVQNKLAGALADITASIALCVRVSQMQDAGVQRDEHAAMAKAFTTARMRETVARCREILGGNGIQLDHGVARYFADAEAVYSYEGTHDMNTLIVGRAITGHQAFV